MEKRSFSFRDSSRTYHAWESFPTKCPHCGRTMSPELCLESPYCDGYSEHLSDTTLVELFRCTFEDCKKYFIVAYAISSETGSPYDGAVIPYSYSHTHIDVDIPSKVESVSPSFVKIYNQAVQAENYGLDEIAGIGYRKALEFLIKDYTVQTNPERETAIKKENLGKVIADELDDFPRLKQLAKAANWIGTDQTHYVQKYSGADLQSMKSFIKSAALFVSANANADEAQQFTDQNDPKKQSKPDGISD